MKRLIDPYLDGDASIIVTLGPKCMYLIPIPWRHSKPSSIEIYTFLPESTRSNTLVVSTFEYLFRYTKEHHEQQYKQTLLYFNLMNKYLCELLNIKYHKEKNQMNMERTKSIILKLKFKKKIALISEIHDVIRIAGKVLRFIYAKFIL